MKIPHCFYFLAFSVVSVHGQQPINDFCEDAVPVSLGMSLKDQSNMNASSPGLESFSLDSDPYFPSCDDRNAISGNRDDDSSNPGIWYSITGSNTGIRVLTCSFDSIIRPSISVYGGGCNNARCEAVSYLASDNECGNNGDGAWVNWYGVEGEVYHILVTGGYENDFGLMDLTISELPDFLPHDVCENAQLIDPNGGDISVTMGNGLTSIDFDAGFCGIPFGGLGPSHGVWYKFEGTGKTVQFAQDCGDFETGISVYAGLCGNLECVWDEMGEKNFCDGYNEDEYISVDSQVGTTYYVLIQRALYGSETFTVKVSGDSDSSGGVSSSWTLFSYLVCLICNVVVFLKMI